MLLYVGKSRQKAVHFLLTVAVLGEQTARYLSINDLHLRGKDRHSWNEEAYPALRTRRDDIHMVALLLRLSESFLHRWVHYIAVSIGKALTESVELALRHAPEAIAEEAFLSLLVGIEMQEHERYEVYLAQQCPHESPLSTLKDDDAHHGILQRQRAVKVKNSNSFHIIMAPPYLPPAQPLGCFYKALRLKEGEE